MAEVRSEAKRVLNFAIRSISRKSLNFQPANDLTHHTVDRQRRTIDHMGVFRNDEGRRPARGVRDSFHLDKSYSRRRPSPRSGFSVFFFILFSFALRRLRSANNPDALAAVPMDDRKGQEQRDFSLRRPTLSQQRKRRRKVGLLRSK